MALHGRPKTSAPTVPGIAIDPDFNYNLRSESDQVMTRTC